MRAVYLVPIGTNLDEFTERICAPGGKPVNGYGWNRRELPGEKDLVAVTITSDVKTLLALPWDRIGKLEKVSDVPEAVPTDKALALAKTWERDKADVLASLVKPSVEDAKK